jgi:mono/diheme cytochrome c family protein
MWKKIVGITLLVIVCLAGGVFAYLYFRQPQSAPPSNIKVDMSAARIERGKYIYNLGDCDGCHSEHDIKLYDFPVPEGKHGAGQIFPVLEGPGTVVARNITPDAETGIGKWTDGEKIRAIREGISRDGSMLFPIMPYTSFRHMSDDDVQSLVAYLNTLPPVRHELPRTQIKFLISLMVKGVPEPVTQPDQTPPKTNQTLYGEYLATIGSCETCHTPLVKGQLDYSRKFGGGREFRTTMGTVVSANITPDKATGIGDWTLERFQDRFYKHRSHTGKPIDPADPEKFTVMPWENLSKLPPDDLEALYNYLRSQLPLENKVDTHPI